MHAYIRIHSPGRRREFANDVQNPVVLILFCLFPVKEVEAVMSGIDWPLAESDYPIPRNKPWNFNGKSEKSKIQVK